MSAQTLGLDGTELFDILGIAGGIQPRQDLSLIIRRADGKSETIPVTLRMDTPIEADYYRHGGILPYMLKQLLSGQNCSG
jgi:aconitate hydratase